MPSVNGSLCLDAPNTLSFNACITKAESDLIMLEPTYFYPRSGGQSGDWGEIILADGAVIEVIDTLYGEDGIQVLHKLAEPAQDNLEGMVVDVRVCQERRDWHTRMHTALHIVTSIIQAPVTGCRISGNECKIDFDLPEPQINKAELNRALKQHIIADYTVKTRIMSAEQYRVDPFYNHLFNCPPDVDFRIVSIEGLDSQPCCGTHVATTKLIGDIECYKIKSHGKKNRRYSFRLNN
ncbi:hypothetical protein [Photobacterium minamisatsumaniensis]|uniref:hypothetical protein n=1 Tax=Photobacterium minamisatsumaniensis TaxID=2910233 RepID=UPI003D0E70E5